MEKIEAIIFDWIGTLVDRNGDVLPSVNITLRRLGRRCNLGLISKADDVKARRREIEESGLSGYFDPIIVDKSKEKKHYIECMRGMGVEPSKTAVVGDRASREIAIGNQLRCTTFWIQEGDRSWDAPNQETGEPNYRINSIQELSPYI